ncbi:phosphotriesterase family protein [Streptomyces sp. NPDC002346]
MTGRRILRRPVSVCRAGDGKGDSPALASSGRRVPRLRSPAVVATVRAVLGDVPAGELGVCDAHGHLFLCRPALPGQELDDPDRAADRLRAFRGLGGRSVVQWTPYGMGRGADTLAEPARSTDTHQVAATGLHQVTYHSTKLLDRIRSVRQSVPGSLSSTYSSGRLTTIAS